MEANEAGTTPLPRWKKVLFSGIMLGVVFGTLELASAWYLKRFEGYDGVHLLQYEFDPYKNILPTRNFVDTRGVRHNAQGFRRSTPVSLRKEPGTYRIFLMGGSTAYGTGGLWPHLQRDYPVLDNAQTIDAYLERELAAALPGRRIEVINAGIPSIWTHHELIYLNQTILRYDPDMVVFLDGFNDFYFTDERHDQFTAYAYGEHAHVIMGEPTLRALGTANLWWLSRRSAFVHLALRQGRTAKNAVTAVLSPPDRTPLDVERSLAGLQRTFQANALKMVERNVRTLSAEGVVPVFVLQPMLILERERSGRGMPPVEQQLFRFNVDSYLPNYEPLMKRAVPFVSRRTRETVHAAGGVYVDATPVFSPADTQQIFTDYAHLTPYGNRVLARRIGREIVPLLGRAPASEAMLRQAVVSGPIADAGAE